jgi:hypothetical protein
LTIAPSGGYKSIVHHVRSSSFGRSPLVVVVRLNGLPFLSF